MTIASILLRKNKPLVTIEPGIPVINALQLMQEHSIGSVIVVDDKNNYLGLFTERDYSRKVALLGKNSNITSVSEIMSLDTPVVNTSATIDSSIEIVNTLQARYLPVIENKKAVGIISILDLIEETANYHKFAADNMEQYVRNT
jgi:CBS domain-containing protein